MGPWLSIDFKSRLAQSLYFILVSISLYVVYALYRIIRKTRQIRKRYNDIPSLPRHPLWGNLVNCGEKVRGERHPDYGFEEIWESLGQPPAFLMDLAPVDRGFLIIAEPRIAEAIVQPSDEFKYSSPKSDTMSAICRLVGAESLLTKEGEDWKNMRKRFNPGFQPKYLYSLAPSVVEQTLTFIKRLEKAADEGCTITLADYAKDLTTDIITQLTIERDLHAQCTPEGEGEKGLFGILRASRCLSELVYKIGEGINLPHMLDFRRPIKGIFYEYIYDVKLTGIVAEQLTTPTADEAHISPFKPTPQTPTSNPNKSIVSLALNSLPPNPTLVLSTVHQIKTFLFAGQDTTATLIQWLFYELSHNPHVYAALRAEYRTVFGDSTSPSAVLMQPGEADRILPAHLPYTTAVIRETLRLHPPAATARLIPASSSFAIPIDPSRPPVSLAGLRVYPCQWLIHRNPLIWGSDAHAFRPERWLDAEYVARLPPGAWRAFERGPRNCIGQELAMLEGKVVLVCVVERGLGMVREREVWNKHNVTSVPFDGMECRIVRVGEAQGDGKVANEHSW